MWQALLRRFGWDEAARERRRQLAQACERLIDASDKRLRLLSGYQQALLPGMQATLDYLEGLPQDLPQPLELSLPAFSRDPRLGLLFAGPDRLSALLTSSEALRDYFLSAGNGDEAWMLLTMQRSETRRLGLALQDGELRRDVAQLVVSFDRHRLSMPCPSWPDLQQHARLRGRELLAEGLARHLEGLQLQKLELEAERERLRLCLTAAQGEGRVLMDGTLATQQSAAELRRQLEALEPKLAALRKATELEGLLNEARELLEHPATFFRIESCVLNLSRMGVCGEAGEEGVTELRLEELVLEQLAVRRALLPVRVTRQAMQELARYAEDC